MIEFVFMLTRDDVTVGDAADVLASLRESGLRYVGFKDVGPPLETLAGVALDLLAYRHATADPIALTRAVAAAADGPVIAAGSVTSFEQIAALEAAGAWGFTIGSAIFAHQMPGPPTVPGQVAAVLEVTA